MPTLLRRVTLRNYKSIGQCKVDLGPMSLLVGPNGSGKSNFLDAIRLVSEGVNSTLEYAIRQRGGIGEVRRRSGGHPNHFTIGLRLNLGQSGNASFSFKIGALDNGGYTVQHEAAAISTKGLETVHYEVSHGEIKKFHGAKNTLPPRVTSDRLLLPLLSADPLFRPLFDALAQMGFYNINPEEVRKPQPHDRGDILDRTGRNLAGVIKRIESEAPQTIERVSNYIRQIVPNIEGIQYKQVGPQETIEFLQTVQKAKNPWRFWASTMSDGTLRSLGVLTALFQFSGQNTEIPRLIAIEEPESTIHPAAAAVLMDALLEASRYQQIVATTHSPDLLDHPGIQGSIIAVSNTNGETKIAEVDEAATSAIRDGLFTAGELLRQNQLQPSGHSMASKVRETDFLPGVY